MKPKENEGNLLIILVFVGVRMTRVIHPFHPGPLSSLQVWSKCDYCGGVRYEVLQWPTERPRRLCAGSVLGFCEFSEVFPEVSLGVCVGLPPRDPTTTT